MAELYHHGILGQRWGVRHGPPYPLTGGRYSPGQIQKIRKKRRLGNKIYNKKHFDEVLSSKKTTLSTLSYDPNRTKNADMFYATHNVLDKHQYNALFNRPIPQIMYDGSGNKIGTDYHLKFRINNRLKSNIKVASEDSSSEIFANLYKNDRDFYNFITDESRMQSYFVTSKYKFKGYREAANALKSIRNPKKLPSEDEVKAAYRMFNYVIPYDGAGNKRAGHDVAVQRVKFFEACKEKGYGAVLDTNDAIYGGFKAKSPIIVFDMDQVIPDSIKRTTYSEKRISRLILAGRKMLGL